MLNREIWQEISDEDPELNLYYKEKDDQFWFDVKQLLTLFEKGTLFHLITFQGIVEDKHKVDLNDLCSRRDCIQELLVVCEQELRARQEQRATPTKETE